MPDMDALNTLVARFLEDFPTSVLWCAAHIDSIPFHHSRDNFEGVNNSVLRFPNAVEIP